jgi:hypothetical protein
MIRGFTPLPFNPSAHNISTELDPLSSCPDQNITMWRLETIRNHPQPYIQLLASHQKCELLDELVLKPGTCMIISMVTVTLLLLFSNVCHRIIKQ